jgi:phosphoribosyl-dephospho-CoA transferase
MRLHRHDLLGVDSAVWDAMLRTRPDLADLSVVALWARCNRPVIVRRRVASDPAAALPAGLPLPPMYGKRRLAFNLASDSGVVALSPVLLRDAAQTAPPAWQPIIGALLQLADTSGLKPRVFGALLWQYATGLPYLRDGSDLDLLWSVSDEDTTTALVEGLARLDRTGPIRLDGELIFADGAAVNWREFGNGNTDLLIKNMDGVQIRSRSSLFRMRSPSSR